MEFRSFPFLFRNPCPVIALYVLVAILIISLQHLFIHYGLKEISMDLICMNFYKYCATLTFFANIFFCERY